MALDAALGAYRSITATECVYVDADPPARPDYQACCRLLGARFPQYGYYWSGGSADLDEAPGIGDAIDDLADIWADFSQALWFAEKHGESAAFDYLRTLELHWAQHLRDVSLFLHTRIHRNPSA